MGWKPPEIERLKRLWADGCTALEISRKMVGKSRSAIIGKAWRLGLTDDDRQGKQAKARAEDRGERQRIRANAWYQARRAKRPRK